MDGKSTSKLMHEIKAATNLEDYLSSNQGELLRCTLPQYLNRLLLEKNKTRAEIVRASNLDRSYLYQIFSGEKTPSRDKLIAIAIGFALTIEETQKLLKLSGNRELYPRDARDAVILFCIQQGASIAAANEKLFALHMDILS